MWHEYDEPRARPLKLSRMGRVRDVILCVKEMYVVKKGVMKSGYHIERLKTTKIIFVGERHGYAKMEDVFKKEIDTVLHILI